LIRPSFRSKKPKIEVNIDFADDGEVVDLDMVDEDEDLMDIDDELKEFDS